MKLPRPYIPIPVRLQVAQRQYRERFGSSDSFLSFVRRRRSRGEKLAWLVGRLFPGVRAQLDHDPALVLRKKILNDAGEIIRYVPDANNPAFLIWREKSDHLQKTMGRKPGASRTVTTKGSDSWLARKFRKLELGAARQGLAGQGEASEPPLTAKEMPSRRFQRRSTAASITASKKGWKARRKMDISRGETKPKD